MYLMFDIKIFKEIKIALKNHALNINVYTVQYLYQLKYNI